MASPYLTSDGARHLQKYTYTGTDNSIFYSLILSPLSNALIQGTPTWISPNMITMLGVNALLLIYVSTSLHCGSSLSCRLPDSVSLICTMLYFAWVVFDNMDGKQARRTQSSTPLGLIYDRQSDAIEATVMSTFFGILSLYGNSPYTIAIWTIAMIGCYFENWEACYTGSYSSSSNKPLFIGILALTCAMFSPEFFTTTMVLQTEIRALALCVFCSWVTIEVSIRIFNVLMKSDKKTDAFMSLGSLFYLIFCVAVIFVFSPSGLAYTGTREVILFLGFIFAREMGFFQIAHISDTEYEPLNTPNFALLSFFMFNTSCHAWGFPLFDEYNLLLVLTILAGLSYIHFIYSVTHEITKELNIPILTNLQRKVQSV
ncbi:unnamed protein product [Blepharisma stoltei]|uniref:Ethanolaminephosphotransferase n=1 Tax=Blepharisma stoltei TaxID=1481888 RepID=A0AAU9K3D5_9CILI|nr:unnamed protein product [Blepharisma stoltei]